jgi:acetylornithine deacetylase/succinyl-diaminopimelate desuccinylase-like protein
MDKQVDFSRIFSEVNDEHVLWLEQSSIRIPSPSFQEHDYADFLANHLSEIGFEVEMMEVVYPKDPEKRSRQPIARLRGAGGGPTLMINGHMDPGMEMSGWSVDPYEARFKDGWVWGIGAHDDKGGLVAAICGVEALIRSGMKLKGDVLITPVVAHKYGGAGTRALLQRGTAADFCINMEHSALTVANVCVGIVMARIRTNAPELFFRYSNEAKSHYFNPIEQQSEIMRRIGPSLDNIPADGWLTYKPHPDLPGFPKHTFDTIHKEHYYNHENYTGMTSQECEMVFQLRTVPGQTVDGVRADLTQLLDDIKVDYPAFNYTLTVPAYGADDDWFMVPMEINKEHPLVTAVATGQKIASGTEASVGGLGRLGNVGDGNLTLAAGIPTLQYGPGDIRIYKEWPTPDERVPLEDLVTAARTIAYAAVQLCG